MKRSVSRLRQFENHGGISVSVLVNRQGSVLAHWPHDAPQFAAKGASRRRPWP